MESTISLPSRNAGEKSALRPKPLPNGGISWFPRFGSPGPIGKRPAILKGRARDSLVFLPSGRRDDLLELLDQAPYVSWTYRRYGVEALLAEGKKDEALAYAENSRNPYDSRASIDKACEDILFSCGQWEEAYNRYAFSANKKTTHVATFRAIAKRYSMLEKKAILHDLISQDPGQEGKWFASAKELGEFELALDLAFKGPSEPKTLNRAAKEHLETNPGFAAGVAVAAIKNLCAGHGYEPTELDAAEAYRVAIRAATKIGAEDKVRADILALLERDVSFNGFASKAIRGAIERSARNGEVSS